MLKMVEEVTFKPLKCALNMCIFFLVEMLASFHKTFIV